MNKTQMRIIMAVCGVIIGFTSWRVWFQVRPLAVQAPPVDAPLVPMEPPSLPTATSTGSAPPSKATSGSAAPKATFSMARRAAMLLSGGWKVDDKATLEANAPLSKADAARLKKELAGMRGTVTVYEEDGTLQLLRDPSLAPLGRAQWRADGLGDQDVLITFQHPDETQTQQRVLLPAYDRAATQNTDFVFVWNRHAALPRAPAPKRPTPAAGRPSSPLADFAAPEPFRLKANAGAPAAWDNAVAQERWEKVRKTAQQAAPQAGCPFADRCQAQCGTDSSCLSVCLQSVGCDSNSPLYVK